MNPQAGWIEDFRNAIRTHEELETFFETTFPKTHYPLFIPRNMAEKIKLFGVASALGKQFLPQEGENLPSGRLDPIGDKVHSQGSGIIHRYKNRVLFAPTPICPVLCRYCFRKNELTERDEMFNQNFEAAKIYLKENPEINEVIFTGGDPFILANEKLAGYIQDFSEIESIKYIRFHTRTPVILPSRIDDGLIDILTSAKHLFKRAMVMVHINHPMELTGDVEAVLGQLIDAGIEVYSQTVLLKGVNDNTETLAELFTMLSDIKVKPYYLHHPDQAKGAMHFWLSLEEGRRIVHPLHDRLSGWMLPQYVIDVPGGEGKISALNPETFEFSGTLLNRSGLPVNFPLT